MYVPVERNLIVVAPSEVRLMRLLGMGLDLASAADKLKISKNAAVRMQYLIKGRIRSAIARARKHS